MNHGGQDPSAPLDLSERGAAKDGVPQTLNRRLYMQLFVLRAKLPHPGLAHSVGERLRGHGAASVIYEDFQDPAGIGVLTFDTDENSFIDKVRPALASFGDELTLRPEMTMLGRSYSTGYESDLKFWLIDRPVRTVLDPACPWAVWYPLRRSGAFEKLEPREKGAILREHGEIGKRYGAANLAHDVRLACHGLDSKDNEFVIGLIGKDLYPLSHVVQHMRGTRQTSEFIVQMGPFFVGRAAYRYSPSENT